MDKKELHPDMHQVHKHTIHVGKQVFKDGDTIPANTLTYGEVAAMKKEGKIFTVMGEEKPTGNAGNTGGDEEE